LELVTATIVNTLSFPSSVLLVDLHPPNLLLGKFLLSPDRLLFALDQLLCSLVFVDGNLDLSLVTIRGSLA
jgi:hypothetical protein